MANKLRLAFLSLAMLCGVVVGAPMAGAVDHEPAEAQFGALTQVAGDDSYGNGPNQLWLAEGIVLDDAGFLYVVDSVNARIQKVSPDGIAVTIAGGNGLGDGANQFHNPKGMAIDADGSLYIADTGNHRIQKVAVDGTVTTAAGGIGFGIGPNFINFPLDVAVDRDGSLLVASASDRVQKITTNGEVSLVLGGGLPGRGPDQLSRPEGITIGPDGAIYVSDSNSRIQKIAVDGTVTTVPTGSLNSPKSVAIDPFGALYIADHQNRRIQRVAPDGTVSTLAGFESLPFGIFPNDLLFDQDGSLYVSASSTVLKLSAAGVDPEPPSAAFGCSQKTVSSNFDVSWTDAPERAVRFVISRSVYGRYWVRGAVTDGSSAFSDGPSPKNSASVYYRVEARDTNGAVVGTAGCVIVSSDGLSCTVSPGEVEGGYRVDISGPAGTDADYVIRRSVSEGGSDFWRVTTEDSSFEDAASPTGAASYVVWARNGKRIAATSKCVAVTN